MNEEIGKTINLIDEVLILNDISPEAAYTACMMTALSILQATGVPIEFINNLLPSINAVANYGLSGKTSLSIVLEQSVDQQGQMQVM